MKSNLLKAERIKNGVTQKLISEKIGITPSTYSRKETGLIEFTISELLIVKSILNLDSTSLYEIFFKN